MKAVRFVAASGEERLGRLDGDTIRDAGPAEAGGFVPSPEAWERVGNASGREHPVTDVRLLHPVVPPKIAAVGLNYREHAEESELEIPRVPVVFAIWPSSLVGHGATIEVPRGETRPDYEGEVAIVLGRTVKNALRDRALEAVGGYSAFADISGRRAQLETPLRQFTLGKSFDTFSPMGPCVASLDEANLGSLAIRTTLSGEVVQESSTANLIFSPEELVAYCSAGTTLEAGTVIATGTPGGVGDSRKPPRYLRDGDLVEVFVEGVGTLSNPVEKEG